VKIKLLTLEDGLANPGFRKFAAFVKRINADTDVYFVVTGNFRSFWHLLFTQIAANALADPDVEAIAAEVADADIIGLSSMTQYAGSTVKLIEAVRRRNPKAYIVWGGIHPIIEPEDAIKYADAICTGEGEFAFERFLSAFKEGRPYYNTPSFWFNTPAGIKKNINLPLMTQEEMDGLPIPLYQDGEYIFRSERGFTPIGAADMLYFNGLSYHTLWSIGCPLKCTYCGNTKFIEYDKNYRKIRHPSPAWMIAELKDAVSKHPHISSIVFHDDSFMALPMKTLEEFCELYERDVGLPFVVTGLIPNYVREDKMQLLIHTGMNRVRMGIQSGSQAILEFYERPTPIARVRDACRILNKFKSSIIPPAFDIILDNPVETIEDNRATLDLLYEMPRPYTLNIFALRVIPNTRLADAMAERGLDLDSIRKPYTRPRPTLSNVAVVAIAAFPLPKRIFDFFRARAMPYQMPQPHYPGLMLIMRFCYLITRMSHHLRVMDLTVMSNRSAVIAWRTGLLTLWQKVVLPRYAAARSLIEKPPPVVRATAVKQDALAS
jgi:anaerobic magnesium-protoporphyrin IX monomethyl ester cyclase